MEETFIAFLLKQIFGIDVPTDLLETLLKEAPKLFEAIFKDKRTLTPQELAQFNELKIKARIAKDGLLPSHPQDTVID